MPIPSCVFYLTPDHSLFTQVKQYLPAGKFSLTHVANLEALEELLASHSVNILLCDLPLPGKPALQTLDALQLLSHLPVVLLGQPSSAELQPFIHQRGAVFLERSPKQLSRLPQILAAAIKPPSPPVGEQAASYPEHSQLILENLMDGVWLLDMSLRPLYINPNAQKTLGYSMQELQQIPIAQQMPPDALQKFSAALAEALSPANLAGDDGRLATQTLELELYRKNAPNFWVEASLTILRNARNIPTGILAVFHNISKRKEAEKLQDAVFQIAQLTYSVQNLTELYHSIHRILGTLMRADNFYIAFFDAAKSMVEFPYFVDEFDPPPPPRPLSHGLTEYVIRTGQPVLASPELFEHLINQNEVESVGAISFDWLGVPLNVRGKTIGMMAVQTYSEGKRYTNHDLEILTFVSNQVAMVVERKRIEEISNRYASIVNNARDLMSLIDRSYTYVAVNDAYCQRYRLTREEVIGRNAVELWGNASFDRIIKTSLDRCLNGEEVHNEDWFDFNGFHYGYYKVSYYPYRNELDEVTHAIVITHDITKHMLSEVALKRRLEMEKLAAATTSRLINIPANQMDVEIHHALQMMGEFINADRSFLNWFNDDLNAVEKRLEWCTAGISSRNERFSQQNLNQSPNHLGTIFSGQPLILSPLESDD
ncbi:MAG TPA: PAS domain S-box protein, partial [Anaerolineaceae bacterium]|nr:PAS domain S-box protein [Anaerolineaceae bacterium]